MSKQDYETPWEIFDPLHKEFRFHIDACADEHNWKHPAYWDKKKDGLVQNWAGLTVWVNPPHNNIKEWVKKAITASNIERATVVMLIKHDCSTRWYRLAWNNAHEIREINHRVKYNGKAPNFPSAVFVFRSGKRWRRSPKMRLVSFE